MMRAGQGSVRQHRSGVGFTLVLVLAPLGAACSASDETQLLDGEQGFEAPAAARPAASPSGARAPPARPVATPSDVDNGADALAGDESAVEAADDTFAWQLPQGFPRPLVPDDNPMSVEKVELGRHLFYDERLSGNQTMSCASCHEQRLAFSDGRAVARGSTGEATPRNAMSLANVAYAPTLTWSHPYLGSLERQAQVPMFGDAPVELGLRSQAELEQRLAEVAEYQELFARAFPEEQAPITLLNVTRALASFERSLISGNSPFDAWIYGRDDAALSESALRGYALFNSEKLECFHCHLSFNFTDQVVYQGQAFASAPFHNTGLYDIDGRGGFPEPNTGIYEVTRDPGDMGKFKAPTLRNIAVSAPYMHDGSIATLSEVLDHYAAAGRTISEGEYAGDGSKNPHKDPLLRGFTLTDQERADVLAFLDSLTDRAFLEDPDFADPWPAP
jgi:cytochrome c peroxidase